MPPYPAKWSTALRTARWGTAVAIHFAMFLFG